MSSLPLHKILSPRWIQDTGRELWQDYHDRDALEDLPMAVMNEMAKEICVTLYPDDPIPENCWEISQSGKGYALCDLIEAMVEEYLDVDELTREAEENTEELREIEEAAKGRY